MVAEHRPLPPRARRGAGLLAGRLALAAALTAHGALAVGSTGSAESTGSSESTESTGSPESTGKAATEHTVTMEGMHFGPETLTVKSGDRVTWANKDLVPHTASSASGSFDSQSIGAGASWTYTAGRPGTYHYVCRFHPGMQATLIVQ